MLVFPNNSAVYTEDLRCQYMLGTELLVAPTHDNDPVLGWVFLPENITWVVIWNNFTYPGKHLSTYRFSNYSEFLGICALFQL